MQALLLATGESHKLRPITDQIPSPLIPITNQPVMQFWIELLAKAGIKDIIVSLHHLAGSIEAYFGEGRRWGVNIQYVLQRDSLNDAGSLYWARGAITGPMLVLPADEIVDLDVKGLIQHHQAHKPLITAVTHRQGPADRKVNLNGPFGYRGYHTGIYLCEPEVVNHIIPRKSVSIFDDLIPLLQQKELPVSVFQHHGYWNPLQDFQAFDRATKSFFDSTPESREIENRDKDKSNRAAEERPEERVRHSSIPAQYIGGRVWVGRSNAIHPTVKIVPPVVIGDNCQIGREVELGPYAVIGSNVIIDDEATISESTIANYTYIGQLVQITNRFVDKDIMVDLESSESTRIVDRFLLGEATPSLVNSDVRRVFDGVVASGLIVLLLPFAAILALVNFLASGRTVERVTRHGIPPGALATGSYKTPQPITLHRFTTTDRQGKPTWFGRFLKRTTLMRLPELFDVMAGRIGFVGVKPLRQEELEQINAEWQKKRFEYNVGMTGLWFTELNRNASLDEILITDVYYIATRTWRGDLKLLAKTPLYLWRRAFQ